MKEMVKKCSTDQRIILEETTSYKIHTSVVGKKSAQHSKVKNEAKTRPSIALNAERFGPLRFAMKA